MKANKAKENILSRIKKSLQSPVPKPFATEPVNFYTEASQDITIEFAENFNALNGRFSFCSNAGEVVEQLNMLLASRNWVKIFCSDKGLQKYLLEAGFSNKFYSNLSDCDVAITTCEVLVARTGSMLLSSALPNGRTASVYAPIHICIAQSNQVVYDIGDAITYMQKKYNPIPSMITLASGPSRTADIEKTLVTGVHGPKEVFCLLIEDRII